MFVFMVACGDSYTDPSGNEDKIVSKVDLEAIYKTYISVGFSAVESGRISIEHNVNYNLRVVEIDGDDYGGTVLTSDDAPISATDLRSAIQRGLNSRINNLDLGYSLDTVKFIKVDGFSDDVASYKFTLKLDSGYSYSQDAENMIANFGNVSAQARSGWSDY